MLPAFFIPFTDCPFATNRHTPKAISSNPNRAEGKIYLDSINPSSEHEWTALGNKGGVPIRSFLNQQPRTLAGHKYKASHYYTRTRNSWQDKSFLSTASFSTGSQQYSTQHLAGTEATLSHSTHLDLFGLRSSASFFCTPLPLLRFASTDTVDSQRDACRGVLGSCVQHCRGR